MGITKYILKAGAVLLFCLLAYAGQAQINAPVVKGPDGKKYYEHTVEAGQSLWQLRKVYDVSVDDIKAANPEIGDGNALSIGQRLLIPVTKENKKEELLPEISGDHLVHTVQRGESLLGIANKYKVGVNDILAVNPQISNPDALAENQKINIPVLESKDVDTTAVAPAATFSDSLMSHTVKAKETLYAISKQYGVTVDEIFAANPGLKDRALAEGETIRIPKLRPDWVVEQTAVETEVVYTPIDSGQFQRQGVYDVALVLPLYLMNNDKIQRSIDPSVDKTMVYPRSVPGFDFYHGAMLAIDSLEKQGLSVNVHVFDVSSDSTAKIALNNPKLKGVQLIIGPFHGKHVASFAKFAKEHQIALISPVSKSSKALLGNSFVSKVTPSNTTQVKALANYVIENHRNDNLVLVDSKKSKDALLLKVFRQTYDARMSGQVERYDSLKAYAAESHSIKAITAKFKADQLNVIVLPSRDLAYVSYFFTLMAGLDDKYDDYQFRIYGLEDWISYDDVSMSYKHRYDLHVTSSTFMNYNDTVQTYNFINAYRNAYKGKDPGKYSVLGFDVTYYYLFGMMLYGTGFPRQYGKTMYDPVHLEYKMRMTGAESGFENQNVYILQFSNFQLVRKR